jgi:hypothetical protein
LSAVLRNRTVVERGGAVAGVLLSWCELVAREVVVIA